MIFKEPKETSAWFSSPNGADSGEQCECHAIRKKRRSEERPESEMNALFHREQPTEDELFMLSENQTRTEAFEATGDYRPQLRTR